MKIPEHTADAILKSIIAKLEKRCDMKMEAKTKGIFMQQIRGIICSLEADNGKLRHAGFITAFDNIKNKDKKPVKIARRRWK